MLTKAESPRTPRSSFKKVLGKVGVYGFGGTSSKRYKYSVREDEDRTMELEQLGAERTKNVLILMSDTGGGHRASAEAIREAFRLEYGDEYRAQQYVEHVSFKDDIKEGGLEKEASMIVFMKHIVRDVIYRRRGRGKTTTREELGARMDGNGGSGRG